MKAVYFCIPFMLFGLLHGVEVTKQGTLYEWNPGDEDKANALGKQMIVGYHHDFIYLERRALFQFSSNETELKIFFTITPAETDVNLTICNILEQWGEGNSTAANPIVGSQAQKNDVTWRYPFYGEKETWENHIFGGYFDQISGIPVEIKKGQANFTVNVPPSEFGYLIKYANTTRNIMRIYGITSKYPPKAQVVRKTNIQDYIYLLYYVVPASCLLLLLVGSLLTYFLMRKKGDEYMPLLSLEEGDIHLTQLQGIEQALIESKVKRVSEADIQYGKRIGSGTTGEVFSAKLGNTYVAVKKIKLSNLTQGLDKNKVIGSISSEITILSKLDHVNILTMVGLVIGEGYEDFGIVTRLMRKGNLTHVLYNTTEENEEPLDLKKKIKIIQGIANGMLHLHKQKPVIIHRDLKPENILIDEGYVPKITDFGISRYIEGTLQNMTMSGTPSYMAPESFLGAKGGFSKKSDVFSFGVIVTEIITEKRPNAGQNIQKIMIDRSRNRYSFELPETAPKTLREIVAETTFAVPSERLSFSDIIIKLKNKI